jgi:hypothetical protein
MGYMKMTNKGMLLQYATGTFNLHKDATGKPLKAAKVKLKTAVSREKRQIVGRSTNTARILVMYAVLILNQNKPLTRRN